MRRSVTAIAFAGLAAVLAQACFADPVPPPPPSKTKPKKKPQARSTRKRVVSRSSARSRSTKSSTKYAASAPHYRVPVVTAELRSSSLVELTDVMRRGGSSAIENEGALVPFFFQLYRSQTEHKPVHILQFGDSHTASDDWANTMRTALQNRFGDGGPGFTDPGRPYRGYRNFRAPSGNSDGWHTDGIVTSPGDGRNGLGGISLSTARPGESVWIQGSGEQLELYYLQQPGGGQLTFMTDNRVDTAISTDGPLAPTCFRYSPEPGWHTFEVRTVSNDPVRLLGWVIQNSSGVTYETLGINGAQADLVNGWDDEVFGVQVAHRDPALIVFAYGTNEALSPRFSTEKYRAAFSEALAKLRRASPTTSILVVGPPDCWLNKRGHLSAFPHIDEVIDVQRQVAAQQRCAFWDWRQRMGGEGSKQRWVTAGMAQGDYVHFTSLGYQLVGNTLCNDMLDLYNLFVTTRNQAENDRSSENPERAKDGLQK